VVKIEDIANELILNWDHTPVNIVPGSQWTMAQKGAKRIEMIELDDKRQITAVVCGTLKWQLSPFAIDFCWQNYCLLAKCKIPKELAH